MKIEKKEAIKVAKVEDLNDLNQIVGNEENVKTDKIQSSVLKPFYSGLSTSTTSPILKKVEIIETIIPKKIRV